MKNIFIALLAIIGITIFHPVVRAQSNTENTGISRVSLTASGLTCSMCSKAIFKSLSKIQAVDKVDADVQNSIFLITFKKDNRIVLEELRKAVQDAGFSVASFRVDVLFKDEEIATGIDLMVSGNRFSFPNIQKQKVSGLKTLQIIDKGYLSDKDRAKYNSQVTGNTFHAAEVIYHVVLTQS
ncbi:heavy-metal-associated domain-containing protein [Flavitalea flava]